MPGEPACGRVAPDAIFTGGVSRDTVVFVGDCERGVKYRVAGGVRHHAAGPLLKYVHRPVYACGVMALLADENIVGGIDRPRSGPRKNYRLFPQADESEPHQEHRNQTYKNEDAPVPPYRF